MHVYNLDINSNNNKTLLALMAVDLPFNKFKKKKSVCHCITCVLWVIVFYKNIYDSHCIVEWEN